MLFEGEGKMGQVLETDLQIHFGGPSFFLEI
jgi:hypothetical protein